MEDTRYESESLSEPPDNRSTAGSSAIKLISLTALTLLLMIPVVNVLDLVRERRLRAEEVRREVGAVWGGPQTVGAVVLTLPYRVVRRVHEVGGGESRRYVTRQAYILPEVVDWKGRLDPEVRARGIFEVPVYQARLTAGGHFGALDLESLGIEPDDVLWDRATVRLAVSDPRGIQTRTTLDWGGEELAFTPAVPEGESWMLPRVAPTGLETRVGERARKLLTAGSRAPFRLELVLRGAERLHFLPLGEATRVELASPWPAPSFDGAFLPRDHTIDADGFRAHWDVTYFGRGLPQSWTGTGDEGGPRESRESTDSGFGLSLASPADQYQQTERSVKYALLFITLTFTTLFLLELLSPVRLHPVQYLLVGFALCLFYVLLLALGEHLGFRPAYLIATGSIVALITLYTRSLLRSWRRVAPLPVALIGLYGYLYGLLRAEDLSLLLGAVGLFALLALVMYLTRGLDWWTLRFGTGGPKPGEAR